MSEYAPFHCENIDGDGDCNIVDCEHPCELAKIYQGLLDIVQKVNGNPEAEAIGGALLRHINSDVAPQCAEVMENAASHDFARLMDEDASDW
ncbi:hypothetical protein FWF74_03195 [Candidatus Saccharibacteria bacterium]|nr:hypothetical protein [Candidatus Saccharibacteria bacterium]MCL1962818.1 hypothetical protein [Candidatus Saccharibacteria bacterium]